ncbi:PHP domain-containing protein [Salinirarus marinus]|uniref:PHP domain-containing protein n=1 Tax=Salinirarus marinus TaxID=3068310 RepID=UPI003C6C27EA
MDSDAAVVADLHVHTTASDGQLRLGEIPAAARAAGLSGVAVTDHDRVHPGLDAPVTTRDGVTVIRGIELRVDTGTERIDLLGYGVERTDELDAEIERLQRNRVERARRIVACVEERLGVDLALDVHAGVGRPHVARAVDESDADYGYQAAFDHLIGDDGPCYVAREIPSFERGVSLLDSACSLVSLAHPLRYDDPEAALDLTAALDAVERYYPYGRPVDPSPIDRAIERHGLVATGGSDAHDRTLGRAGLAKSAYDAVLSELPKAQA